LQSQDAGSVITLAGFDWNCPQHIPQRYTLDELTEMEINP